MYGSEELALDECLALLRSGVVGRAALSTPSGPLLVAVPYLILDGAVLIRASAFGLLGTHGRNALMAFEVDDFDGDGYGWSVVVQGRAKVVTDPSRLVHIHAAWSTRTLASDRRQLTLSLPVTTLTGSRSAAA